MALTLVPTERNPTPILLMTDLMVYNRSKITGSLRQRGQERLAQPLKEKAPDQPCLCQNLIPAPQSSSCESKNSEVKLVPPQHLLGQWTFLR
ncbi:hypothetical protein U1Q18_042367 [Sarracenia purpurea var. burkii]